MALQNVTQEDVAAIEDRVDEVHSQLRKTRRLMADSQIQSVQLNFGTLRHVADRLLSVATKLASDTEIKIQARLMREARSTKNLHKKS